jgi:hypothetical protein
LFRQEDIPWDALAFPVMEKTLRQYVADRCNDRQHPATHVGEITHPMDKKR